MKKLINTLLFTWLIITVLSGQQRLQPSRDGLTPNITVGVDEAQSFKHSRQGRSIIFEEGFDETTFPPPGWTRWTDLPGNVDYLQWHRSTNWWNNVRPFGVASAASRSWNPETDEGINPNNYLITPQINIPTGLNIELSWMIRAEVDTYYGEWGAEQYTVYISTTGNAVGNFTTVLFNETFPLPYPQPNPYWMFRAVDLNQYAGQSVYFAFRHHDCFDNSTLILDEVVINARHDYDMTAVSVTGPMNLSVGFEGTYDVLVRNAGHFIANGWSVRLVHENTQLAIVSGIPLEKEETAIIQINWSPLTDGLHNIRAEIIWAADQNADNNLSQPYNVIVHPVGMAGVYIGDLESNIFSFNMPYNFAWRNSLTQVIYFEEEIGVGGTISNVEYTYNGVGDIPYPRAVRMYMATTDKTFFESTSDWIPYNEFTLVYEGTFPANLAGVNDIMITLDNSFLYSEGNLVIMTYREFDHEPETGYFSMSNIFKQTENLSAGRTLTNYSDIDVLDPSIGTIASAWSRLGTIPNTQLYFVTSGLGSISGTVTNNGEPLADAIINLVGTQVSGTTNAQGVYSISHIVPGNYDISATKTGYLTYIEYDVDIEADSQTELNFVLEPASTVTITGKTIASDTNQPLVGASVTISGYATLPTVLTNSSGDFTVPNVFSGQDYIITIAMTGYTTYVSTIEVAYEDYSTGDIMIFETPYPPDDVVAEIQGDNVVVTWQAPSTGDFQSPPSRTDGVSPLMWRSEIAATNGIRSVQYSIYRTINANINNPDLWTSLSQNQTTASFTDTTWSTLETGIYNYLVVAVYANNNPSPAAVSNPLSKQPAGFVYIGNPTSTSYNSTIPFNYAHQTGVVQTIYHDAQINVSGAITEIVYRIQNNQTLIPNAVHQVFMAITDRHDFPNNNSWIPYNQFTLVFEGYLPPNIPSNNEITIQLNYPFPYDSGNLVIMTNRQTIGPGSPFNTWQTTSSANVYTIYAGRDGENYDLQDLPTASLTTDRPNIAIKFSNEGIGHLSGIVRSGTPLMPLSDVRINLNGTERTVYTNTNGEYSFRFLNIGTVGITATKDYYIDQVINNIQIVEGETTQHDFVLEPLPTVTVTGTVVASDTNLGLSNANITLEGHQDYINFTSNENGLFTIPGVYSGFTYTLTITRNGYLTHIDSLVEIGTSDTNLGNIVLTERTIPARNVQVKSIEREALITWEAPGSTPGENDVVFSHSSGNADSAWGGDWAPDGIIAVHRWTPEQLQAAGVAGADLTRIQFHIHPGNESSGLTSGVVAELRVYTGGTGTPLQPGTLVHFQPVPYIVYGWNNVELTIPVAIPTDKELWFGYFATYETGTPYSISNLGHGFHGYGYVCFRNGEWGHVYDWTGYNENWMIRGTASGARNLVPAISDRHIDGGTPSVHLRTAPHPTNNPRILESYKIYRVPINNLHEPLPFSTWELIEAEITDFSYLDTSWKDLTEGFFRYAVIAVFSNDQEATPAFSNAIEAEEPKSIQPGTEIIPEITKLTGNYPNPFNPSTTISFDLAESGHVNIDIFNIRGQKIKVLLDSYLEAGFHKVEWNGIDNNGLNMASGVYFIKMSTNDFVDVKRMVLMK